jgi:tRNA(adenine34) deaminase
VGQPTVGSNPTPSATGPAFEAGPAASGGRVARQMARTDDELMALALAEAGRAADHGDVPVGALVVVGDDVVASRHNERELHQDPTAHAEVLALRDAAAALGRWRLADATLVVTLEPCTMCAGALVSARVARVVVGARDLKAGGCCSLYGIGSDPRLNHEFALTLDVRADESAALLTAFFAVRR